jgi:hypothetical protein
MEFMKTFLDAMEPTKLIDQAEKNMSYMIGYVQPKELASALTNLTEANAKFAKTNLETLKTVVDVVKDNTTKFIKSFDKTVK